MGEFATTSGLVNRDGFTLQFVREGTGVPMLVIGSEGFYRRFMPASLREQFEIVFCDLRFWVRSPEQFDTSTITRDTHIDDIEAIRSAAGLERPIVVGHSIHGSIALDYARRYADRVSGVAAIAAAPIGGGPLWQAAYDFYERDADPVRRGAHDENLATRCPPSTLDTSQDFVDRYIANAALYWYDPTFDCTFLWEDVEANMPVFVQLFDFYGDHYQVEPVELPVFLALGRYDYVVPFHLWDVQKDRFGDLRYELFERSGHSAPLEQPDEFSSRITDWAQRL